MQPDKPQLRGRPRIKSETTKKDQADLANHQRKHRKKEADQPGHASTLKPRKKEQVRKPKGEFKEKSKASNFIRTEHSVHHNRKETGKSKKQTKKRQGHHKKTFPKHTQAG